MVDSLKHLAFDVRATRGRRDKEEIFINDKPFSIDYERLISSRANRRLENKTQVFFDPDNPHTQKRSSHTRHVIVVACAIARGVQANKSLTRAIGAGHDLGQTPYGHITEKVLSNETHHTFTHANFGVILLQDIEPLNLSWEVLKGILKHSDKTIDISEITQECRIVQISDRVFLFDDAEDALRYGYKTMDDFPPELLYFGKTTEERTQRFIQAVIRESLEMGFVSFEHSEEAKAMLRLRDYMYSNVYLPIDNDAARSVIRDVFHFLQRPEFEGRDPVIGTALMTDSDALWLFLQIIKDPNISFKKLQDMKFSITEIKAYMDKLYIDFEHPDLSWGER